MSEEKDELDIFLLRVLAVVDVCIMDRAVRGFAPTVMIDDGVEAGKIAVYGMDTIPSTRVTRRREMGKIAMEAHLEGVIPLAMAVSAMFVDENDSHIILTCVGDSEKCRFGIAMLDVQDDGILSIRETYAVPSTFDASNGFGGVTKNLMGLVDVFYKAFDGEV